jgi:acyl-CoA hydrolase
VGIVNPNMPDVPNGPRLPLDRFAGLVQAEDPLPTYEAGGIGAQVAQIADHIVGLLGDGCTLQLGLGKVQTAVLAALARSRLSGLGFHAGMISAALLQPLRRGLFSRGVVSGVALGDRAFYAAVAELPEIVFAPVGHTHDAAVLARTPGLVSVNSVIEMDLFGQANAEAIDGRQVSGQGGLLDFHRAARVQAGGRAILALASTAKGGTISRIVPRLAAGTPVCVARGDVDIVVTEHGVAQLGGLSLTERAHALICIADPRHRTWLREGLHDFR